MDQGRTVRCLVTPVGSDSGGGGRVFTRALRDAGFEVIYAGPPESPADIVRATVQEDVDVLGLSSRSGPLEGVVTEVVDGLEEFDAFEDTLLVVVGSVPDSENEALYGAGVAGIFDPGDDVDEAIAFVRENVPERR